jgi:exopolyphosphatase/guanosine-5'-triphosphate,3'-diphosphate pyrophosphatase
MKGMENKKIGVRHPVAALVDLGSNSVKMLIARVNSNHSHTVLTRYRQMVRLGEGVFETGRLADAAVARTIAALRDIADMCREYNADEIAACATAAVRGAANAREFIMLAERETGIRISVIPGQEEARLIHLGVASGLTEAAGKIGLFVDIGGGSTEVIAGQGLKSLRLDSLRIGAVRVAERFPGTRGPGPVPPELYMEVCASVRDDARQSLQRMTQLRPTFMAGSGGTVVNLAEIASRLKKTRMDVKPEDGGRVLTRKALDETANLLCAASLDERRKFPGINPQRADIIAAGSAILQTIMDETGMESITASSRGLLDGMLADRLLRGAA